MPRLAKPLTDTQVKTAKPREKIYTLRDGGGMYLEVSPSGSKIWRMAYRQADGKSNRLTFGSYPEVSLAEARVERSIARKHRAQGLDPAQARRNEKAAKTATEVHTFEAVARQWLEKTSADRGATTQSRVVSWFDRDVFPIIGNRTIGALTQRDLIPVFDKIEARGAIDSAHRVHGYVHSVFGFAAAKQLIDADPMFGLKVALATKGPERHFAAITAPASFGQLLCAIDGYEGHPTCASALKVLPDVFVRPVELRTWEWIEIDFDRAEWIIPGEKMKMKNDSKATQESTPKIDHFCDMIAAR